MPTAVPPLSTGWNVTSIRFWCGCASAATVTIDSTTSSTTTMVSVAQAQGDHQHGERDEQVRPDRERAADGEHARGEQQHGHGRRHVGQREPHDVPDLQSTPQSLGVAELLETLGTLEIAHPTPLPS